MSRASRKYNKSRSYIYFWKARWDGSVESLACRSRRPHSHPNQHTQEELKLIQDMRRRNPTLGLIELWSRLQLRGYTRRSESLYRVMRRLELFPAEKAKKPYKPKLRSRQVFSSPSRTSCKVSFLVSLLPPSFQRQHTSFYCACLGIVCNLFAHSNTLSAAGWWVQCGDLSVFHKISTKV